MIILRPPFNQLWKDKNPFDEVEKLRGETFRSVKTRRTIRFEINGEAFYLKLHHGITYREFFKNILSFKIPVCGARNEWSAINRLKEIGVDTMEGAAFGETGLNPIRKTSFIITKEIAPAISLEDFCKDWKNNPPSFSLKRSIIKTVAEMVRKMHASGVNHRDCYLCHFLLSPPETDYTNLKISLIDLHRAQIREEVPNRWRDKDLVALYFSSLHINLTRTDYCFFLKNYFPQTPLKAILARENKFLRSIDKKAKKIAERTIRKGL